MATLKFPRKNVISNENVPEIAPYCKEYFEHSRIQEKGFKQSR